MSSRPRIFGTSRVAKATLILLESSPIQIGIRWMNTSRSPPSPLKKPLVPCLISTPRSRATLGEKRETSAPVSKSTLSSKNMPSAAFKVTCPMGLATVPKTLDWALANGNLFSGIGPSPAWLELVPGKFDPSDVRAWLCHRPSSHLYHEPRPCHRPWRCTGPQTG